MSSLPDESTATRPRVSVVMPAKNEQTRVAVAIRSIIDQGVPGIEIVVVDDHSADRTADVARSFCGVVVAANPGSGLVDALNHGLAVARGEIVVRLDADDVSLAGGIAALVDALDERPHATLAIGAAEFVDENGTRLAEHGVVPDRAALRIVSMATNPVVHSAVAFRRQRVIELGGYQRSVDTEAAEDFDLWVRLLQDDEVVTTPFVVAAQTLHRSSATSRRAAEQRRRAADIRRRNIDRWHDELGQLTRTGRAVRAGADAPGRDQFAFALCRLLVEGLRQRRTDVIVPAATAIVRLGPHRTVPPAVRHVVALRRRRKARGW